MWQKKRISYWDSERGETVTPTTNNGIKLETFIFDVFPLAKQWVVMECLREDEFAPVKNAPGEINDSPDTARQLISDQCTRWLRAAGSSVEGFEGFEGVEGVVGTSGSIGGGGGGGEAEGGRGGRGGVGSIVCEISPLLSYNGEGLEQFAGQIVKAPCYLE